MLVFEQQPVRVSVVMFDLGRTLEIDETLLPGAEQTLQAVSNMIDPNCVPVALTLVSDWTLPTEPEEAERDRRRYYELLEKIGLREFFEPVERMVTISSEVGVYKPDSAIFRAGLDKIALDTPVVNVPWSFVVACVLNHGGITRFKIRWMLGRLILALLLLLRFANGNAN